MRKMAGDTYGEITKKSSNVPYNVGENLEFHDLLVMVSFGQFGFSLCFIHENLEIVFLYI